MGKAPKPAKPNQPKVDIQMPQQPQTVATPFGTRMGADIGDRGAMAQQMLAGAGRRMQPWQMQNQGY